MKQYIHYLDVDFGVTQIRDFTILRDNKTNAICWSNGELNIWASPGLDGDYDLVDLQLEFFDEDGSVNLSDGEMFFLEYEGDLEAQKARYLSIIEAIIVELSTLEFYTNGYKKINSALGYKFWKKINL